MKNFTALDFETANNSRHSACQIGLCIVREGQIADQMSWLIKPPERLFLFSGLHGITYDKVRNQMTFGEIWPMIRPFVDNQLIVAHNASFDIGVLAATLAYYQLSIPEFHYIDTVQVAKKNWPWLTNHRLSTVAEFLNVELQHHEAASDAKACAEIMLHADCSKVRVKKYTVSAPQQNIKCSNSQS